MPLVRCYDCKELISNRAIACPKCGAPHKGLSRVQLVSLILTTIAILAAMVAAGLR